LALPGSNCVQRNGPNATVPHQEQLPAFNKVSKQGFYTAPGFGDSLPPTSASFQDLPCSPASEVDSRSGAGRWGPRPERGGVPVSLEWPSQPEQLARCGVREPLVPRQADIAQAELMVSGKTAASAAPSSTCGCSSASALRLQLGLRRPVTGGNWSSRVWPALEAQVRAHRAGGSGTSPGATASGSG
jgi:hypothetical protein